MKVSKLLSELEDKPIDELETANIANTFSNPRTAINNYAKDIRDDRIELKTLKEYVENIWKKV